MPCPNCGYQFLEDIPDAEWERLTSPEARAKRLAEGSYAKGYYEKYDN